MYIYVDISAPAYGDGSKERPFCKIEDAQAKIRDLKKAGCVPSEGITVSVAEGEYYQPNGLRLTEEDSGTEACPITYVSEKKHGALLSGGVRLKLEDFQPLSEKEKQRLYDKSAGDKILKLDLKKYGVTAEAIGQLYSNGSHVTADMYPDGTGDGEAELFVNGSRMTLSRYPNSGYLRTGEILDEGGVESNCYSFKDKSEIEMRGGTFRFDEETAKHIVSWKDDGDLWTFGYFKYEWEDSTIRISAIDREKGSLTLEHHCMFGMKEWARYYFFNVFEELDTAGEYYIDRKNAVLYFYPTEEAKNGDIFLTVSTKSVLSFEGASNVVFKDFAVAYTRNDGVKINGGFDKYKTWSNRIRPRLENAVDGRNITIDGCKIYAVREAAVFGHGEGLTVQNCEIFNIGTNAVYLSGGNRNTLEKSGNLIHNNLIHDWSQYVFTYCGAIGMQGCGTVVSHNEIYNSTHFAVLYLGNDHVIEYNDIHHVCLDTDDCGAVYTGRSYSDVGTVLRYNYIHSVGKDPVGDHVGTNAEGIYFDDNMSGQTVYGNILADISGRALHFGGGREIICKNNVIVDCQIGMNYDIRGFDGVYNNGWYGPFLRNKKTRELERLNSVPYQGDIWAKAYPHLAVVKTDPDAVSTDDPDLIVNPSYSLIKNNVAYAMKRQCRDTIDDRARRFSEIEDKLMLDNIAEDFPNWEKGDFTMSSSSKIKALLPEFEEIPFEKIGRIE